MNAAYCGQCGRACRYCKLPEPTPAPREDFPEARKLIAEVEAEHQLPAGAIYAKRRFDYLVRARREAIRRLRESGFKLKTIGYLFKLDHSTVLHYLDGSR